jgi:2'-5' RNA ligase
VKEKIVPIQEEIKKLPIVCKFVEKENLHICFSFLGELKESSLEEVEHSLEILTKDFKSIKVRVDGIKLIPNENFVRVLALDVVSDELELLMAKIKKEVGGDVKPPHITLCRVKNIRNKEYVIQKLKEIKVEEFKFLVDSICLIKSELKRSGPVYTIMKKFNLF